MINDGREDLWRGRGSILVSENFRVYFRLGTQRWLGDLVHAVVTKA